MRDESILRLVPAEIHGTLSRRELMQRFAVIGLSIPAVGSLLAACGDDDEAAEDDEGPNGDASGAGDTDTETPTDETDEADDAESDEGGVIQEGGTLIIGHNREPDSLDPHKVTAVIASDWMLKIYDTLVTVRPDLTTIEPGLADAWEASEDGLTYTFTLKEGVEFHSGDPLTASDVKFTIDRWVAEETGSPTAHRIGGVTSVETPDEQTVVLHLEARNNELLINLASGFGVILNQSFVEEHGDDYGTLAVDGTGPFKLDNWAPRAEATLSRFDKYTWGPPFYENTGPAHIEQLVFRIIPEDTTRVLELQSGGVHIVPVVPTNEAANLEDSDDIEIIQGESGSTTYLGMNMRQDLMSDENKPVRVAIMHAIDKEQIVNEILSGYAEVAHGPVAPWIEGALPDVEQFGYEYDPEKAKQILEEAGWVDSNGDGIREKDGVDLVIPIYAIAGDQNQEMMGLFSSNLQEIGVGIESVLIEEAAIWARLAAGEHTVMLMGMPHSTPDEILMFYFLSDNQPAPNRFGFADPEVDEWLREAREAPTREEWLELYQNIQKRILEKAFWMPLYHPYQLVGVRDEVEGFVYYGLYQMGTWKLLDVWLND
ncbi:MAG: ABC transporter substrate-binding protein [Chloroflexota bacterium]|nr:ABC transporter substrate-binding protein [Chloroflexota bacterium]